VGSTDYLTNSTFTSAQNPPSPQNGFGGQAPTKSGQVVAAGYLSPGPVSQAKGELPPVMPTHIRRHAIERDETQVAEFGGIVAAKISVATVCYTHRDPVSHVMGGSF
jgi:hypothetical protein